MQQSRAARILTCKVCNMEFNGPDTYKQHMDSARHHKNVLASSKNAERNPKPKVGGSLNDVLKCNTCDKTFNGPLPYNEHMKSKAHKRTRYMNMMLNVKEKNTVDAEHVESIPGHYFCEICNIHCNGSIPFEQHQNSRAHRNQLSQKEAKY